MFDYFDKDFFRFLLGFVAIICTSVVILMATRLYQEELDIGDEESVGAVIKSAKLIQGFPLD